MGSSATFDHNWPIGPNYDNYIVGAAYNHEAYPEVAKPIGKTNFSANGEAVAQRIKNVAGAYILFDKSGGEFAFDCLTGSIMAHAMATPSSSIGRETTKWSQPAVMAGRTTG